MIHSGKPDFMIHAAEIITDRLQARSEGTFRSWLADTVGELRIQDATLLEDLAALLGLLAMLNYDHLLEKATGQPAITWQTKTPTRGCWRSWRPSCGRWCLQEGVKPLSGPDDMPAHIRTVLTATSLSQSFQGSRLLLGAWQAI